jgi:hypothetical protein
MAGKDFSIVAKVLMNSAGFTSGKDKITKEAKSLERAVQGSNNIIKDSFSNLTNVALPQLGGQFGNLGGAVNTVKGVFGNLVGAAKTLRTALISTGIGAIIIAITTALGGLVSYLKGTEDGANKLNKVLGIAKGVFNAILLRVQLLGEAVALVFSGKFKEAGQKLKEAFQGGLLQEIKDDAKEAVGYAERENKLWKDKLELKKRESEIESQVNDLKLVAWNQEIPAKERQDAITKAKSLEMSLMTEKVRLAQEEYDIVKSQNAMGNNSRADTEKEVELYVKINQEKSAYAKSQKEYLEKQLQINKALQNQGDIEKELPIVLSQTSSVMANIGTSLNKINSTKLVQMKAQLDAVKASAISMKDVLGDAFASLGGTLLQGADSFKDYAKSVKAALKETIGAIIAEAVATMVGSALKDWSTKVPFGYIIAPAMAAMAGGLAKTAFNAMIPSFATGGIMPNTGYALVGEQGAELVKLPNGSRVYNNTQTRNIFNNSGGSVEFIIRGSNLVGVQKNYFRGANGYR